MIKGPKVIEVKKILKSQVLVYFFIKDTEQPIKNKK